MQIALECPDVVFGNNDCKAVSHSHDPSEYQSTTVTARGREIEAHNHNFS